MNGGCLLKHVPGTIVASEFAYFVLVTIALCFSPSLSVPPLFAWSSSSETLHGMCVCAEKSRPTARHTREDHKNGPNELPYQGTVVIKAKESGNQGIGESGSKGTRQSGNRVESHGLSRALRQYLLICI